MASRGSFIGTVLIVDDDPGCRALMADLLRWAGYSTREAATGEEAIASLREEAPSLVLLDVQLPGVSGYEVCREIREELGLGLPVVFVSGNRIEPLDRVAGLIIGANDYVLKPFSPDELLARVRALLRGSGEESDGHGRGHTLSPRELEILRLLAEGVGQAEIARRLVLSTKTVANHIEHILVKLDVHSRTEAIAKAYRQRLLRA